MTDSQKRPSAGRDASPGNALGATILHRKDRQKNAFATASRAIGAVMDAVDSVAQKVTLENIAHTFSSAPKRTAAPHVAPAPVGVTQAYSLVLTHLIAPVWAVRAKAITSKAMDFSIAQTMDTKGIGIELHADALNASVDAATAYIALLVARLTAIETSEYDKPPFAVLAQHIIRDAETHSKDVKEFDDNKRENDEAIAHDQAKRKLTEVGGTWKPRGAVELVPVAHALRHSCLVNIFYASVCFRYNFADVTLQQMIDSLASQLFLVNYNESLVSLVAGQKGPQYIAKYFLLLTQCVDREPPEELVTPRIDPESAALQDCIQVAQLALTNLVHRNDISDLVINSMIKAIVICPPTSLCAMFSLFSWTLHQLYCVDIALLVLLLNAVRPFLLHPAPVGISALRLMETLTAALQNVNCLQRRVCSRLVVAGNDVRSFRRAPAHLLISPYCAKSHIITKVFSDTIEMRRTAGNRDYPVVTNQTTDSSITTGTFIDDLLLYISNSAINVFQSVLELVGDAEESSANMIELASLFSLAPHQVCTFYPSLHQFLDQPKHNVTDAKNMDPRTLMQIVELYSTILDRLKPAKGQRRFRSESPILPILPLIKHICTENDDATEALRDLIDQHWRYCDARISDKDIASLHPKKELSLSHFIEQHINVVVCGGNGFLRRMVTGYLLLKQTYPGAVPQIRIFLLPLGTRNDMANWIGRCDSLYLQNVFLPFSSVPPEQAEVSNVDSLKNSAKPSLLALRLRDAINDMLLHATEVNEVLIYQAECVSADGSVNYIPFLCNLEIGTHINAAAKSECCGPSIVVSNVSFSAADPTVVQRAKSSSTIPSTPEQKPLSQPPVSPPLVAHVSTGIPSVLLGTEQEPINRVLVMMHGQRGIPLATKKHPSEGREVKHCATGSDVLDWISTTFHLYDASSAHAGAGALLDAGLITCLASPPNKDAHVFAEAALYGLKPREPLDAPPQFALSRRSYTFERAQGLLKQMEETLHNVGIVGSGTSLRVRVTFVPREGDLAYNDLKESMSTPREVICLKIKSTGSSGDIGALPNPTSKVLHMSINEEERRRPVRVRDPVDRLEHYQLQFGSATVVDPRCVLTIESGGEHTSGSVGGGEACCMYCGVDGDIFGPFSTIRVRPVVQSLPTPGGPPAVQPAAGKTQLYASLPFMSYVKCHDR